MNSEWLKRNYPCFSACPVNTEAGRYVNLIAQGRFEEAYTVARRPNPFASICGRICSAPCEDVCRRRELDEPISIRALKRFVTERFGVESLIDTRKMKELLLQQIEPKNKKVAIIGSGPAGMSAAHDLVLNGYDVTVFEAADVAGGMLILGIPEYRLPRELVRMELNSILNMGVELHLGKALGRDFSLKDLKMNGYEAVFIAIGAHKSRELNIEGVQFDGVLRGVDFLLNVNLGYKVDLGDRVIVIGGGNVAFDVARTAARQEPVEEVASNITEALDVARSAIRFGARDVHLVCLESRDEMPASDIEIEEALEENIQIHSSRGPQRIVGKNGVATGLETLVCSSVFDKTGKFNPQFEAGSNEIIEADSIIIAIGQSSELKFLSPKDGIEVTPRNTIKVDLETLETTRPGIFAGGDVAFGPRIAIEAVADGRKAAASINIYLGGKSHEVEKLQINVLDTFDFTQYEEFETTHRQKIPVLDIDRRIGIAQVELCYDEETAIREAKRCLRCWVNTEFSGTEKYGSECILCGGCVDICPENCIELTRFHRFDFDEGMKEIFEESSGNFILGESPDNPFELGSVMIKDETICIRCGLCAKRCPTDCIRMESFDIIKEFSIV